MKSFTDEANDVLKSIASAIGIALPTVAEDIKSCIVEHIENEIYTYDSPVYPRRRTLASAAENANVAIGGNSVTVDYSPSGEASGTFGELGAEVMRYYHKEANDPIKEFPVYGDTFIKRIETGKGYDYNTDIGARPFLTHAIEELIEGNRALNTFIGAVNVAYPELGMTDAGDVEIVRDGNDFSGF